MDMLDIGIYIPSECSGPVYTPWMEPRCPQGQISRATRRRTIHDD